jgi:hypothetical protein
MTTLDRGSKYTVPPDAVGDARFYGVFRAQSILGYVCDIAVVPVTDDHPEVRDILGVAQVCLLDSAVHVSGIDPFGQRTGPGFVRAIGCMTICWQDERVAASPPSGLGCRAPEIGIIVSWDGDAAGTAHRDATWQHHCFYAAPKGFLTLRGVFQWWRDNGYGAFGVRDIARAVDAGRPNYLRTEGEAQHEGAFRRLLEGHLGVSNTRLPRDRGQPVLQRVGRWEYTFMGVDHGTA